MTMLGLESGSGVPLTDQIINGIRKLIDDRVLRQGAMLPSIRSFAAKHGISRHTVVQAYDKLVAMGYLDSRRGAGFYVSIRRQMQPEKSGGYEPDSAVDVVWLLRNALDNRGSRTMPGAWWLPAAWMEKNGLQKSLRSLSQKGGEFLTAYGTAGGYLPLRELLQSRMAGMGVVAETSQIVLTSGVTHALDLVARLLVRPGDAVLVDDPGYFILFGGLKSFGARIFGVPWNVDGPDTQAMEALIQQHRPRVYFTNTVLHNPTGASISLPVAHRMLQLAERYDMTLVEDDIYGDFHPANATRLATLDQLERVVYVSSFSKSVSASLRVGYLVCKPDMARQLTDVKLLTGLTTSEVGERLMYQLLTEGHYRKHIDRLRSRLQQSRTRAIQRLESLGFEIHCEPEGGMFLWARPGSGEDSAQLSNLAATQGVMLAPGSVFHPDERTSSWLRFNVAHCEDERVYATLAAVMKEMAN